MTRILSLAKYGVSLLLLAATMFGQAPTNHQVAATLANNNAFTGTDTFAQGIGLGSFSFANLGVPSTGNGTLRYCANCQATTPCSTTGSGVVARYEGGQWNCGGSGGGGGGQTISVNASAPASISFNGTTPAAQGGFQNATFQIDGSGNASVEVPIGVQDFTGATGGARNGHLLPLATDYGIAGMQQVGSGVWSFSMNSTGTMQLGYLGTFPGNQLIFSPSASAVGFTLSDTHGDAIVGTSSGIGQGLTVQSGGLNNKTLTYWSDTGINETITSGGIQHSAMVLSYPTGYNFILPITVSGGCTGCGGGFPDPFQFNAGLPVSLLNSVVGKSGMRFDPTDGTLYFVDKALGTTDVWGQVVVAQQSGASGNIDSKGLIDQVPVYISTAQAQFFTLPNGAVGYSTSAGGFHQAGANELSNGVTGTGAVCLKTNCVLITPSLGDYTATSGTFSGTGASQIDMTYSGVSPHAPTAGHNYIAVDSNNLLELSVNGGNYFNPAPGDQQFTATCGGTLGPSSGVGYIFAPANQSTTTCAASALNASVQETPFAFNGTIGNLQCSLFAGGAAGDVITIYKNNVATALSCAIGTGTSAADTTHQVTVVAGDAWSARYVTNAASDPATGMRISFGFIRTP